MLTKVVLQSIILHFYEVSLIRDRGIKKSGWNQLSREARYLHFKSFKQWILYSVMQPKNIDEKHWSWSECLGSGQRLVKALKIKLLFNETNPFDVKEMLIMFHRHAVVKPISQYWKNAVFWALKFAAYLLFTISVKLEHSQYTKLLISNLTKLN